MFKKRASATNHREQDSLKVSREKNEGKNSLPYVKQIISVSSMHEARTQRLRERVGREAGGFRMERIHLYPWQKKKKKITIL